MRVLVIGPSWIGDMVMAQSLFRCLHSQHSELAIDVLALDWTRDLLARMPEVNQAISMPVGHGELALGKRLQLARLLRRQDYQQAIVLPNSFKSALIPFFAKIPVRTGWRGEARSWLLNDCRILDERVYPLMVQRFAALGFPANSVLPEPLPVPLLEVSADVSALLEKFTLDTRRPVVVFCPGAEFGVAKQWPEEHFAKVADVLISEGKQIWLMGSNKDAQTTTRIIENINPEQQKYCRSLAGLTSIGEAIDLMSLADIVLSNDSGLMHIAAALNKPLIVLYGSTSPKFTPPLTDKVKILSLNLACSPCFKRECPLGHLDCLRKLLPATVIEAMNLLESELQGRKPTESGN
tara:strand:- start:64540 stop:65592 length:1053 start_codon:yes stop_codon:yes gene_type:complete